MHGTLNGVFISTEFISITPIAMVARKMAISTAAPQPVFAFPTTNRERRLFKLEISEPARR
jgi:hypothetical protein